MPLFSRGHQKEHVKSEDRRPRGGQQWKKKENNSDGHRGAQPERKHKTEAIGVIVSRPYVPAGAKKKGEDDGDALVTVLSAEWWSRIQFLGLRQLCRAEIQRETFKPMLSVGSMQKVVETLCKMVPV